MRKQHGIRRLVLGSLVVLAVAVAALGSGPGASAENATAPLPDYGSKEAFKEECERLGGMFTEGSGGTSCLVEGWAYIECDANGNSCTLHNSGPPRGDANSPDGTGEQNESDGGGMGYPGTPGRPQQNQPDTLPNLPADD